VGNSDAHAKNISFFCSHQGLELTPAYDIVAVHALSAKVDLEYAMAVGDAFTLEALDAEEWNELSIATRIPLRAIAIELEQITERTLEALPAVVEAALAEGANAESAKRVKDVVLERAETLQRMARDLVRATRGARGRTSR
jgi:serine/threonine-protein kinase HipA